MEKQKHIENDSTTVEKREVETSEKYEKFINLVSKSLVRKVIKIANEKGLEIFKVQQ